MTPRAPGAPPPTRSREEKYDERRNQLAESALATLGELGYARTSLREIAQNSEFSHGVVHYYFANKIELITYCVRYYKATCVTRYDDLVATAATAEELATGFADKLVETITDEAPMHRLWYDLRTQSMFEPELREAVLEIDHTLELMIWRIVRRYADLQRWRAGVLLAHDLRPVRRTVREGPALPPVRRPGRPRRPARPGAGGGRQHRPLRWVPCTRRRCFLDSRADQFS